MPAAPKRYEIEAFVFTDDLKNHDHLLAFDVDGLVNLPSVLAEKVAAIYGRPEEALVDRWTRKSLPTLRNSLSYHGGEQGIASFRGEFGLIPVHVRVFAHRDERHAPLQFVVRAEVLREGDSIEHSVATWTSTPGRMRALVGEFVGGLTQVLGEPPKIDVDRVAARLYQGYRNRRPDVAILFVVGNVSYVARMSLTRHVPV